MVAPSYSTSTAAAASPSKSLSRATTADQTKNYHAREWLAITVGPLPPVNPHTSLQIVRETVVGKYHVYELHGTQYAAETHAWSHSSPHAEVRGTAPLVFSHNAPIRMHTHNAHCRTAPATAGRGYAAGAFSYALDRVDQKHLRTLDGSFCTGGWDGTGQHAHILDTGIAAHNTFGSRVHQSFDYFNSPALPTGDCNGHGTHVAGLVGSTVYGGAPAVELYNVRVLDCNGDGTFASLGAGILHVLETKDPDANHVINLSLGAANGASAAVEYLLELATQGQHDIVVVASAGNDAIDACNSFPGRLDTTYTVAASTAFDLPASFSNDGPCVHIWAPGESVISANGDGAGSLILSGTSMAAPIVASAAVLIRQEHPTWTSIQVRNELTQRATVNILGSLGYRKRDTAQIRPHLGGAPNLLLHIPPAQLASTPPPSLELPPPPPAGSPFSAASRTGPPRNLLQTLALLGALFICYHLLLTN